jgi:hypothetical protein
MPSLWHRHRRRAASAFRKDTFELETAIHQLLDQPDDQRPAPETGRTTGEDAVGSCQSRKEVVAYANIDHRYRHLCRELGRHGSMAARRTASRRWRPAPLAAARSPPSDGPAADAADRTASRCARGAQPWVLRSCARRFHAHARLRRPRRRAPAGRYRGGGSRLGDDDSPGPQPQIQVHGGHRCADPGRQNHRRGRSDHHRHRPRTFASAGNRSQRPRGSCQCLGDGRPRRHGRRVPGAGVAASPDAAQHADRSDLRRVRNRCLGGRAGDRAGVSGRAVVRPPWRRSEWVECSDPFRRGVSRGRQKPRRRAVSRTYAAC